MKVLFIEPCHVGFGGYFRAINICMALSSKNVKVDLLVASKIKFSFAIKQTDINSNLRMFELPRFYFHFFINGRILRGIIGLFFGLLGKYDIVHACVPVQLESNIPAFFLKLFNKKVIIDWDDYWEGSKIYGEYKIMKKYVEFCERLAPKFFQNFVVVSDYLYRLAKKRGAKKIIKIINGVHVHKLASKSSRICRQILKLDTKTRYLLTFGHTYTHDRAYFLLKYFQKVYELDPTVKLLFNLNPKDLIKTEKLERKISASLPFINNIVTTGYISSDLLDYYLVASNATVFLTGNHDNEKANFPIRIGTYLNGESPIIINDINSEANNTLRKYECAIMKLNYSDLAYETVKFLRNEDYQRKLRKATQKAKKELSWDKLSEKLIVFYNDILTQ